MQTLKGRNVILYPKLRDFKKRIEIRKSIKKYGVNDIFHLTLMTACPKLNSIKKVYFKDCFYKIKTTFALKYKNS